ncbi:Presenilin-1 [Mortierella sp. AM989]|nr:Presenilin-1 [Mortierella sp. AM989]
MNNDIVIDLTGQQDKSVNAVYSIEIPDSKTFNISCIPTSKANISAIKLEGVSDANPYEGFDCLCLLDNTNKVLTRISLRIKQKNNDASPTRSGTPPRNPQFIPDDIAALIENNSRLSPQSNIMPHDVNFCHISPMGTVGLIKTRCSILKGYPKLAGYVDKSRESRDELAVNMETKRVDITPPTLVDISILSYSAFQVLIDYIHDSDVDAVISNASMSEPGDPSLDTELTTGCTSTINLESTLYIEELMQLAYYFEVRGLFEKCANRVNHQIKSCLNLIEVLEIYGRFEKYEEFESLASSFIRDSHKHVSSNVDGENWERAPQEHRAPLGVMPLLQVQHRPMQDKAMPHQLVRVITQPETTLTHRVRQQNKVTTSLVSLAEPFQLDSSVQHVKAFGIVLKNARPKIGGYTIENVQILLQPTGRNKENQDLKEGSNQILTAKLLAKQVNDPLGEDAENVRAIANQPRRRPREPRSRPRLTPEQKAAYEEAERIADMKFYMLQIYKIIKPVVVCMCLSILWIKISMAGSDYRPTQSSYTVYKETATSTVTQNFIGGLANAGIIIGQIVIVTIIIVVLFKRGHIKFLIGFFMVVVAMLLGFMGYILLLNLIQVLRIPLDYVTMCFALWNFAVAGLVSVFWKGPMWLQQVYLTVMSSLMAFSLTGLAEWTTWMLLALLVVWDLIAVLCPFGPLKILVESSKNQNQEVPALLYTVNAVWFMASPPDKILARETNSPSKEAATTEGLLMDPRDTQQESKLYNGGHSRTTGREGGASFSSSLNSALDATFNDGRNSRSSSTVGLVPVATNDAAEERDNIELVERNTSRGSTSPHSEGSPLAGRVGRSPGARQTAGNDRGMESHDQDNGERSGEQEDDDDDGGGLKLGLGDFVFYSLLVSLAAKFDWVTTME